MEIEWIIARNSMYLHTTPIGHETLVSNFICNEVHIDYFVPEPDDWEENGTEDNAMMINITFSGWRLTRTLIKKNNV